MSGITAAVATLRRRTRKCRTALQLRQRCQQHHPARTRLGDHGRFPDEDLHGEVIGTIADNHALQVAAFPRGLDVQRSTAGAKTDRNSYCRAKRAIKGSMAGKIVSKSDAFAELGCAPVSDLNEPVLRPAYSRLVSAKWAREPSDVSGV